MKFKDFFQIENATQKNSAEIARFGGATIFIVFVMMYTGNAFVDLEQSYLLVAAAMIGGYMALNIGANDVANNVGPAVGSLAISMTGAIIIAAIFESSGALIAGGDVVNTVKKEIIDPTSIVNKDVFAWVMMSSLLGAAIWLNIATILSAPVSTTHSIVGGVMGAGIAAKGWAIVNWVSMFKIALSWLISPILGGLVAAGFLYLIKRLIFFKEDRITAAKKVVPIMIAIMAWAFVTYLALKGLKKVIPISFSSALVYGGIAAIITYVFVKPMIAKKTRGLDQSREGINSLFTLPLIISAAFLSFAHGANDVANAIGPLAGIVDVLVGDGGSAKVAIPLWVMGIGAIGISLGLALYGPKLIRTVGTEITELNRSRAFCVALAAAVTVIIASQLGMPISSTHVALGAIFGVGFLREFLDQRLGSVGDRILTKHEDAEDYRAVEKFLRRFEVASIEDKDLILKKVKEAGKKGVISKKERKKLRKSLTRQLVKRSVLLKIGSAWIITVPVSAVIAAMIFYALRAALLA